MVKFSFLCFFRLLPFVFSTADPLQHSRSTVHSYYILTQLFFLTATICFLFALHLILVSRMFPPTYSLSLLICPNHFSLALLDRSIAKSTSANCPSTVAISDFIQPRYSKREPPDFPFRYFTSVLHSFFSVTVSMPYSMTVLTTVL